VAAGAGAADPPRPARRLGADPRLGPGDPGAATALGYRFRWTDLDAAMRDILR
jgi:hypothetical protein